MDPIALIAQIHASGPASADRLRQAGLGDLTALSRADPKHVAEILEINQMTAQGIVRDARRELGAENGSIPPKGGKKKAPPASGSQKARRGKGKQKEVNQNREGVTREETAALLTRSRAEPGAEGAPTSAEGPEGPVVKGEVPKTPGEEPIRNAPDSFWNFG